MIPPLFGIIIREWNLWFLNTIGNVYGTLYLPSMFFWHSILVTYVRVVVTLECFWDDDRMNAKILSASYHLMQGSGRFCPQIKFWLARKNARTFIIRARTEDGVFHCRWFYKATCLYDFTLCYSIFSYPPCFSSWVLKHFPLFSLCPLLFSTLHRKLGHLYIFCVFSSLFPFPFEPQSCFFLHILHFVLVLVTWF